jgi:hypothetical protein
MLLHHANVIPFSGVFALLLVQGTKRSETPLYSIVDQTSALREY